MKALNLIFVFAWICYVKKEAESFTSGAYRRETNISNKNQDYCFSSLHSSVQNIRDDDDWKGEVVAGGSMRGVNIKQVEDSVTEFVIGVDGVEADLGNFSRAIFQQLLTDAKQQKFQGFRPGSIPPQLTSTYRAFAMDECARETVLEAMQQQNIRPFTNSREEIIIEQVSIPPPPVVSKKKKKKKKYINKKVNDDVHEPATKAVGSQDEMLTEEASTPQWQSAETMDGAIKMGWSPGQSFSFVATNVKGQNVLSDSETQGANPLGMKSY
mmetsp:Transcript_44961/g.50409  ORF Transcript_44961/g.50409 Transcript_44961/m.50409 type:complete len:269 (-) Transcript_44961:199-1005(-)|eukprot:CAMPEP_0170787558 /NCGR_PEP_ID=MMETSP0733-20121128/18361_1 /TAXON_ID=186038 /ORGANISM="Fragilariopsis kerguelensis, Strain L26-C5" /LENGTH=268 /DNA_ID=CAMNT_0011133801 /DNA_START=179 /DNA_END=985 /DNA_ORIENTATION=+